MVEFRHDGNTIDVRGMRVDDAVMTIDKFDNAIEKSKVVFLYCMDTERCAEGFENGCQPVPVAQLTIRKSRQWREILIQWLNITNIQGGKIKLNTNRAVDLTTKQMLVPLLSIV